MNPNTPFNERFLKISDKLNSIQFQHDSSKAHRIDTICARVTGVEERMQDTITSYNRKLVLHSPTPPALTQRRNRSPSKANRRGKQCLRNPVRGSSPRNLCLRKQDHHKIGTGNRSPQGRQPQAPRLPRRKGTPLLHPFRSCI